MPKFSTQHYNAIAADIRAELAIHLIANDHMAVGRKLGQIDAIVKLALRFAKRFKDDNERFDPLKFLDACSPNEELYPLSELWDEYSRTS